MSRKRAVLAGLFAVIYPGLGHLYLRTWMRAFAWFSVAILTAALVVPESAVRAFETGGIGALFEASADLPSDVILALLAVRVLNVVDAVWIGLRSSSRVRGRSEEPSCPHCGGELDPDLEFCPWCSQPLHAEAEPE